MSSDMRNVLYAIFLFFLYATISIAIQSIFGSAGRNLFSATAMAALVFMALIRKR